MPGGSNDRTDLQLSSDFEPIRTNTDNRRIKDDIINILAVSTNSMDTSSKMTSSLRAKVEILRSNSPTLKRLQAVRIKLDKYLDSVSNTISSSRQSIHSTRETSYLPNPEKSSTTNARIPSSRKKTAPQSNHGKGPLDKITYEKTWSRNGNMKQKCSLEIWLPKPGSDDDEEKNTSRTTTPNGTKIEKKCQSPQSMTMKSHRSSTMKITTTTTTNIQNKSFDETSSKKSEPIVVPRVYHYEDYLTDQPEERPRSGKSGDTNKSDSGGSNKNAKRHHKHSHNRRQSNKTNSTDELSPSATVGIPMTSKNLLANIKQNNPNHENKGTSVSNNSSMISDLMIKYSIMKRSHQELTQPKLQLEKPHYEPKTNTQTMKDHSLPSPPVSASTSHSSSEHPTISVKKLLADTSPPRSAVDSNNTNTKSQERRSSHRKINYGDIFPQARLFSLVHHLQNRQTSASISNAILPAVVGKKNEDPFRSFQRSKTLDVVVDVSNNTTSSIKIPSRLPMQPDNQLIPNSAINRIEKSSARISKRSLPPPPPLPALRSTEQQQTVQLVQYQNVQNSAQRYHHSKHTTTSGVPTNNVLVHLKYSNGGNIDRNCLVPE